MKHDEMKDEQEFDAALAEMMQRVDAPETLERRLMLAAEATGKRRTGSGGRIGRIGRVGSGIAMPMPLRTVWTGAVAAALVAGCALGGLHVRHAREQAKATADFELSERITDQVLADTRQQLQRAGISLNQ